ncbi:MAG TPA: DUF202 domain-containing protein [Thiohalobacter sp.]|nr:DUF202 domain-containing protein [Thiohalobacter sp.]
MSDIDDPRVLFAAERTLLAWNRTSLSLMAFGFVIERFGLFLRLAGQDDVRVVGRGTAFFIGIAFILFATYLAIYSVVQYRRILRTLKPVEIPAHYSLHIGMYTNGLVGLLGLLLAAYLVMGFL